jgi:uncharacterized protein (DUF362 family)
MKLPYFTRRSLLTGIGAGSALLGAARLRAQQTPPNGVAPGPPQPAGELHLQPVVPVSGRSTVSLVRGTERRKMIYEAMVAIDAQLLPGLKRKKYVLIKPNLTSVTNQVASTHVDTIAGILDYLGPRFKGKVVVAEASSNDTLTAFENFKYAQLATEFKKFNVQLIDLNREEKFQVVPLIDTNVRPMPIRMAARLFDPDAFIICCAIPKTHETAVATMTVKNMAMGAPLRSPSNNPRWSDKSKLHEGLHQTHYNWTLASVRLQPFWGAGVVDGLVGMEGAGPVTGDHIQHGVAMASTDYIAVDRVAVETMGIDANQLAYLRYCEQMGLRNFDLGKIDVIGEKIADVKKNYKPHPFTEIDKRLLGPLKDMFKS